MPSGKAAIKGTACHEILELCFPERKMEPADYIGEEMSNGYLVVENDIEPIEEAIDALKVRSNSINVAHEIHSAVQVYLSCLQ